MTAPVKVALPLRHLPPTASLPRVRIEKLVDRIDGANSAFRRFRVRPDRLTPDLFAPYEIEPEHFDAEAIMAAMVPFGDTDKNGTMYIDCWLQKREEHAAEG